MKSNKGDHHIDGGNALIEKRGSDRAKAQSVYKVELDSGDRIEKNA